jgi:hypothetical protein
MSQNFQEHRAVRTTRGRRYVPLQHLYENRNLFYTDVYFQRFFTTDSGLLYFKVAVASSKDAAVKNPFSKEKA